MIKKKCANCNSEFKLSRNPNQLYCSKQVCQRARKNHYQRRKLQSDSDYQANQKAANQRWQATNKSYWKNYRAMNTEYVIRNREQTRQRQQQSRYPVNQASSQTWRASYPAEIITVKFTESLLRSYKAVISSVCKDGAVNAEKPLFNNELYMPTFCLQRVDVIAARAPPC